MSKSAEISRSAPRAGGARRYTARLGQPGWPNEGAGAKADNLHKLARAGFHIPAGFCVLSAAFEEVVSALAPQMESLSELREALKNYELDEALNRQIRAEMAAIRAEERINSNDLGWAVRSSARSEDAPEQSFAGQHKTLLGLKNADEIARGVAEVWASLYDDDALLYRAQMQKNADPGAMAVLIQRMVPADVAGVMFSQNPLSGDTNQLVINAARGLGEVVAQGGAADTYYVDRNSGYIEKHQPAEKNLSPDKLAPNDTGILGRAHIDALAASARQIHQLFETAQDIEWAFSNSSPRDATLGAKPALYILQTRQITATSHTDSAAHSTPNALNSAPAAPRAELWTNVNVGEALPGVATPMTWSIIHDFSRRGFERAFGALGLDVPADYELVSSMRGRIYLNLSQFLSIASAVPLLKPQTLFEMAGGSQIDPGTELFKERASAKFLARLPLTALRTLGSQLTTPLIAPLWARYVERRRDDFFASDLKTLGHQELGEKFDELERLFERTGLVMLQASSNFLMSFVLMREFLRLGGAQNAGGREAINDEQALVSALGVDSANPGYDLLKLGHIARRSLRLRRLITDSPPEAVLDQLQAHRGHQDVALFLTQFERFRSQHGHRAPREAELATPRWREDPRFLFRVLQGYIRAPKLPDERGILDEQRQARLAINARIRELFWPGLALSFQALLRATRANARLRELMRARVVDTLDIYRRYFLECGRRLTLQSALRRPEDIFYLELNDLRRWLKSPENTADFAPKVLQNRALTELFAVMPDPPDTFVQSGQKWLKPEDFRAHPERAQRSKNNGARAAEDKREELSETGAQLVGLPGSPGVVTARARVVLDPNQGAQLQPGEVLVAPWADIGWTPLFLTASALVTALGGPLSHACIVAREYGLPAVVNAHGATELIQTGDLITVDARRGLVFIRERV